MSSSFADLDYLDHDEIRAEFIPGGNVEEFIPGWGDNTGGIPGKETAEGIYIGKVRVWSADRKLDRSLRLTDIEYAGSSAVDGELEEKFEFYYEGDKFHTEEWNSSAASWSNCAVQLPEGYKHTLDSYIELLITNWSYDDINERWWERYQDEF